MTNISHSNEKPPIVDSTHYFKIFQLHSKALWAEAYRYVQDSDQAKQLVQDLMMEVWQQKSLPQGEDDTRKYLFQSIRYRCYRQLKDKDNNLPPGDNGKEDAKLKVIF